MLLAAGLGTRLKPFTDKHPKALAPVKGRTLLEHNIRYLQSFGIREIVVNVHHFAEQIERVVAENNGFGAKVFISDERDAVLETGGGIVHARRFFEEGDFVVMNVDMLTNFDLKSMIASHQNTKALATLAVTQRESSRQLLFDEKMILCGWKNKLTQELKMARDIESNTSDFAFSGIQVLNTRFFEQNSLQGKFSIIDAYLQLAKGNTIKGFDHTGDLILDVGKPESLEKAAQLFT